MIRERVQNQIPPNQSTPKASLPIRRFAPDQKYPMKYHMLGASRPSTYSLVTLSWAPNKQGTKCAAGTIDGRPSMDG